MRIVDAQIHLWGSGLPSNMAHRQVTSFTTEEAVSLMDEGGVDTALVHQAHRLLGGERGDLAMGHIAGQTAAPEMDLSIHDAHHAFPSPR